MFYRETIIAGRTIIRNLKACSRKKTNGEKRKGKVNPTSEAVAKVNFNNAVKMLTAKLNHNFNPGDFHLVLTYKTAPTKDEAKASLKKFIRNIQNYCKRAGENFKWVAVTEYKHSRIHHHLIISKIDISVIDKYWSNGYEYPVPLDQTGNYYKLAAYLLKETEKTFREPGAVQRRRYSCSRTVIMPEVKREKISGREYFQEIKPPAGYYVDQDTVRKYEHAILKVDCMEYIMVALPGEAARIKKWKKGKRIKLREHYKESEQLTMEQLQF